MGLLARLRLDSVDVPVDSSWRILRLRRPFVERHRYRRF